MIELTCLEAQQTSKGVYRAVLFHVEQTVTVHIALFYVAMRTELVITCVTSCVSRFVWIVFLLKKRLDRLNDRSFGSFFKNDGDRLNDDVIVWSTIQLKSRSVDFSLRLYIGKHTERNTFHYDKNIYSKCLYSLSLINLF